MYVVVCVFLFYRVHFLPLDRIDARSYNEQIVHRVFKYVQQGKSKNCFRFASSASALEDQWPCWKKLCNFSSEAFVCVNLGHWPHIGPVPGPTLGCLWGARRPPKGGPETSKRQLRTTQTVSLECLWAAFGGRASRGAPGASRRQPGRPKRGLPLQRRTVFLRRTQKR